MALFGSSARAETIQSIANAAETLLANIRFIDVDEQKKTIVITSSVPNEGKTFLSLALANAMASMGKRTLIVEGDMRRRSLSKELSAHARYGIYSVVSGRIPLENAVVETSIDGLWFLDAEPHIPNPSEFIASRRFADFLAYAADSFDFVIFDTPPVGTFVDAAVLGNICDLTLLVVREGFVRKKELAAAVEQLDKAGCGIDGIIMNCCAKQSSEYYYSHYYSKNHHDEDAPRMVEYLGTGRHASNQPVPERPKRMRETSDVQGS